MKVTYNTHADVLYIVIKRTENPCVYLEEDNGIICRVDEVEKTIVGITIPDFSRRNLQGGDALSVGGVDYGIPADGLLAMLGVGI